ncbi:peptidase inhibitor I9 [Motilibacter peucedani]|uniref:Peptidase inhibitor I9 n=1 Tax=Motilibacter peucedani TaxID=598650 RepID=A0A420XQ32_9ACTN|nr:S8 family serine peptidase [Motilibacter peucedani]RKS75393.1 peptidase inhibitor I9 [Motilibacter peucedani]
MSRRPSLVVAACCALAAAGALPAQAASAASSNAALSKTRNVVVVLKDQHTNLPASGRTLATRVSATAADQRSLVASARKAGATGIRQLHVANAFAAKLTGTEAAKLAADPTVAGVYPDRLVAAPKKLAKEAPAAASAPSSAESCTTDSSRPTLEPEALQLTHTAFADPATPSANKIATGKGVKVAFLAEGIDIDNPDFVRADGSHVFTDYKDFSGEGTAAPTSGGEAFGDASSIAAQGRQVYDLADFASPAAPVKTGCTIRVQGMAPGASLVGLKIFPAGGFAFNSAILAALDYAVTVDHVDVVSESFGSNQFPDTGDDPTALFNEQLVAAGVTVLASSGDAGPNNTIGSPASSSGVISVGATTQFRAYAQLGYRGFVLSNGRYRSGGISGLSSSGFTQSGRTIDLVAPGDLGWSVCTPDPERYEDCVDFKGAPASLELFGGTSESAPLAAGAAALVIQAYRDTHGGQTPAPALVRSILTSTSDDLGLPADEQGSGLLNSLRAVQAARSAAGSSVASTSSDLLVSPTAVTADAVSGSTAQATVSLTNVSRSARTVSAQVRSSGKVLGTPQTQTVTLGALTSPTFLDGTGVQRAYTTTTFTVPPGAQRLTAQVAYPGASIAGRVYYSLLEPDGTFAAHSLPQGNNDYGYVDVPAPVAGTWKAIVFTSSNALGYTGDVSLTTTAFKKDVAASVPEPFTLAPGATKTVTVAIPQPHDAGDRSDALVFSSTPAKGGAASSSVVPVVLRTLVRLHQHRARVEGTLLGTNGRSGIPNPALTYAFDVPAGTESLSASLSVPQLAGQSLYGFLVDPQGEPVSERTNRRVASDGTVTLSTGLDLTRTAPQAGRWQIVLAQLGSSLHTTTDTPFRLDLSLDAAKVKAKGLPTGGTLRAGVPVTATLSFKNRGSADAAYFADARLAGSVTTPLAVANSDYTLVDAPLSPFPAVSVPTETTSLTVSASSDRTMLFEVSPFPADQLESLSFEGDPDREAGPAGTSPSVTVSDPVVAPQTWLALPSAVGPVPDSGAGTIHATFTATAVTKAFDGAVTSSTGNPQLARVDAAAPAASPVTVSAGASGSISVTITPNAPVGTTVSGVLYLDTLDAVTGSVDEVAALPYTYTVG